MPLTPDKPPTGGTSSKPPAKKALDPMPKTASGRNLQRVEKAARSNDMSAFNHTGALRTPLASMAAGSTVTAEQFRDGSKPSPETPLSNHGRHEIASTSQRAPLVGKPVPTAVAATARTSTAPSLMSGPAGEVVAHSGQFLSGMSTRGQATAHTPFHALPATLATHTDPMVASAVAMDVALSGMAKPGEIRGSKNLTGARWAGGDAAIEPPDTTRGHDDGFDSDTERGKITRRHNAGREHLKDALVHVRSQSSAAAAMTAPPSPGRSRGGMGPRGPRDSFEAPPFKKHKPEASKDAAAFTQFAFAGYQTLGK